MHPRALDWEGGLLPPHDCVHNNTDPGKVADIRDSLLNHDGAFDLEEDAQKGVIDPYTAGNQAGF